MTKLQSEVVNNYRESLSETHEFVNSSFLDYIFNQHIANKRLQRFITSQISDANLSLKDAFKSSVPSKDGLKGVKRTLGVRACFILRDINDLVVLALPSQWTDKRICFIEYYYPNYPIPGRKIILPRLDNCFSQTSTLFDNSL